MNGRVLRRTGDPAQTGSPVFGADRQKIEPAGCIVKPGKTGIFADGPLFVIQFLLFTRPFPSSPNRAPAVHRVDSFVPAAGQSHIVGRAISPAANRLAGQPASGRPLAIPGRKSGTIFPSCLPGRFPAAGVNARPTIQGNRQAVPENARPVKALPYLPCWMVRQEDTSICRAGDFARREPPFRTILFRAAPCHPRQEIRRNFSVLPAGTFPGGGRKRPP